MKQRQWSSRVEPVIRRTAVRDVTDQQLTEIAQGALRIDSKGNITGGKAAAGNLYRLLHHMFAKALAWRLHALELGHPLDGMEQPKVPRRERLLSDRKLSAPLAAVDEDRGAPQVRMAIRLAALTGWQIRELLDLLWEDTRLDLQEARLPDTKTGFSARRPLCIAVPAPGTRRVSFD